MSTVRVRAYLIVAAGAFLGSVALCIAIRPDLFDYPHYGLSFFGGLRATIVPHMAGLITLAYCMWAISKELRQTDTPRPLQRGFLAGGLCILGLALTPMAWHPVLWWTHMVIGLVLVITQISATAWILSRRDASGIDYGLGAVFLGSGIALILSGTWPGILGICALSQVLVFCSSLLLMGRAALRAVAAQAEAGTDLAEPAVKLGTTPAIAVTDRISQD
jgi:hypothetical protein